MPSAPAGAARVAMVPGPAAAVAAARAYADSIADGVIERDG
jgi:hypothetical protein